MFNWWPLPQTCSHAQKQVLHINSQSKQGGIVITITQKHAPTTSFPVAFQYRCGMRIASYCGNAAMIFLRHVVCMDGFRPCRQFTRHMPTFSPMMGPQYATHSKSKPFKDKILTKIIWVRVWVAYPPLSMVCDE